MIDEEMERLMEAAQFTINVGGDEIGISPRKILGLTQKLQEAAARIEALEALIIDEINTSYDRIEQLEAEVARLLAALDRAGKSLTKASLCNSEKIDDAKTIISAALAGKERT